MHLHYDLCRTSFSQGRTMEEKLINTSSTLKREPCAPRSHMMLQLVRSMTIK